jgi:hypothetical protein
MIPAFKNIFLNKCYMHHGNGVLATLYFIPEILFIGMFIIICHSLTTKLIG